MHEEWYRWPKDKQRIVERAAAVRDTNVYFSPYLFRERRSLKADVLPSRTIAADLDNAALSDLVLAPTVLVETSPGRHQAYWVLRDELPLEEHEQLSRRVTYSIPDCDHSGWPLGHKFRFPTTLNYKYHTTPPINVFSTTQRVYSAEEMRARTVDVVLPPTLDDRDLQWIDSADGIKLDEGPQVLFEKYRRALGSKVASYLTTPARAPMTRSEALWALLLGLFRAGASRDEAYVIANSSVNNKFRDSKYNASRDLAKEVDRAERAYRKSAKDVKELIFNILRAPGARIEKQAIISQVVLEDLEKMGDFVTTDDGRGWFLRNDIGKPLILARHSEALDTLLDSRYGLNARDRLTQFVVDRIQSYTYARDRTAVAALLSHYDQGLERVLIHGGRSDVWAVTRSTVEKVSNGHYGVLFLWRQGEQPFTLSERPLPSEIDWASFLFQDFFHNLLDIKREDAIALIRVWVLFILMRDAAAARPILALFGQPGSGKSTMFRMLYELFYGPRKSLNAVTTPDNFDYVVASDPLVVFDNVDTWASWLPDRLALSAAASDLVKRKLYTDADTVVLRRQAVVGISAHNPRFGREDVVDRMLILNFARHSDFKPERTLLEHVARHRNQIWTAIVRDLQAVLAEPTPDDRELPQFRITDFAAIGLRAARALGIEENFMRAIATVRSVQTAFNLGEEDLLVDVISRWHEHRNGTAPDFLPTGRLWETWSLLDDSFERNYKTANQLGKKLWVMHESLKSVFDVSYKYDATRGVRLWKIDPKGGAHARAEE